ncbi:MAG: hypothetical protein C0607_03485 [Azoarcus sp.]|nr:MAG: hypothetical protein C0607_03485 [Azoarcus sp.]
MERRRHQHWLVSKRIDKASDARSPVQVRVQLIEHLEDAADGAAEAGPEAWQSPTAFPGENDIKDHGLNCCFIQSRSIRDAVFAGNS